MLSEKETAYTNWDRLELNPQTGPRVRALILAGFAYGIDAARMAAILSKHTGQVISPGSVAGRMFRKRESKGDVVPSSSEYISRLLSTEIPPDIQEEATQEVASLLRSSMKGFWRFDPRCRALTIALIEKKAGPTTIAQILTKELGLKVWGTDISYFRSKPDFINDLMRGSKELPTPLSKEILDEEHQRSAELLDAWKKEKRFSAGLEQADWLWKNEPVLALTAALLELRTQIREKGYSERRISLSAISEALKLFFDIPTKTDSVERTLWNNISDSVARLETDEAPHKRAPREMAFIERLRARVPAVTLAHARAIAHRIAAMYVEVPGMIAGRHAMVREKLSEAKGAQYTQLLAGLSSGSVRDVPLVTAIRSRLLLKKRGSEGENILGDGVIITIINSTGSINKSPAEDRERLMRELEEQISAIGLGIQSSLLDAIRKGFGAPQRIIIRSQRPGSPGQVPSYELVGDVTLRSIVQKTEEADKSE